MRAQPRSHRSGYAPLMTLRRAHSFAAAAACVPAAAALTLLLSFGFVASAAEPEPVARPEPEASAAATTEDDARPASLRRFDGVELRGVEEEALLNLRRKVSLARLKNGTSIRIERFDYFLRILPNEVREALEPFGYYSSQVSIDASRSAESVSAVIAIELGEPVRVRRSAIHTPGPAQSDRKLQRVVAAFEPKVGQPLLHAQYEDSKALIQRELSERGYFDAELVDARIEVTRALAAADIDMRWNAGERYRYGPVRFIGSPFRDGLLSPLVPFKDGQAFEQQKLLELQRRLTDLDYFSRIDVQPRERASAELAGDDTNSEHTPTPTQGIGIDVDLAPAARNVYGAGASYGTDTGAGLRLAYERRWLNPDGHKIKGELLLGQERSAAKLSYRIPAFERFTGWWTASATLRQEPFADVSTDIIELALARDARWRGNLITASLHVQQEQYLGRDDTLVYPELSVERKVVNDPLYPSKGFFWKVQGRWGSPALGSDGEFRQLLASASVVRGFGERNRLIVRGEAGSTSGARFERLPPSLRFYAGGDRSVRGYGYQELSPQIGDDLRRGGPNLLVGSVEWERMFTDQWGAALFVDAGNAYDTRFDPALGVGLGLRWRSPVGPIRLDIAHGLDSPDQSFRLHIQLGPEL